jgi:hypothetical protein
MSSILNQLTNNLFPSAYPVFCQLWTPDCKQQTNSKQQSGNYKLRLVRSEKQATDIPPSVQHVLYYLYTSRAAAYCGVLIDRPGVRFPFSGVLLCWDLGFPDSEYAD